MAVGIVGVQGEETIDRRVDLAAQTVLDAFANHRALLARYGQEIGVGVSGDVTTKRDVDVLARPVRAFGNSIAKFEMLDVEGLRQLCRSLDQRPLADGVVGCGTAVNAEWERYQRMAEHPAPHFRQGQDARYRAVTLRDEIVRAMAENVGDDLPPSEAVKEGRFGTALHKGVPGGGIGVCGESHADCLGRAFRKRGNRGGRVHQPTPFRNTRSARSHRKSDSKRRNRESMCCRLR